jgi:hypothetical protein
MLTAVLVVTAVGLCAWLASRFMWWATGRSAMWAMFAGTLLVLAVLAGVLLIGWLWAAAAYGW